MIGKDDLNNIEVLICKALINSCISHDEFVSVNNVLLEYNEIKEEIKNSETSVEYAIQKKTKTYCVSCKKYTTDENSSFRKTKRNRLTLLSICTFCGKKNQLLLKIKKFQMVSLKRIKSLTNFY